MHEEIQKFSLEGTLRETDIVKTKQRLVDFVEESMREDGYVPSLDIEPQFTLDYSHDTGGFKFSLTVYGIEVGEDKAWDIAGIMSGKEIPRSTPQRKSKRSPITVG